MGYSYKSVGHFLYKSVGHKTCPTMWDKFLGHLLYTSVGHETCPILWDKSVGHVKLQFKPLLINFWQNFKLNRHMSLSNLPILVHILQMKFEYLTLKAN